MLQVFFRCAHNLSHDGGGTSVNVATPVALLVYGCLVGLMMLAPRQATNLADLRVCSGLFFSAHTRMLAASASFCECSRFVRALHFLCMFLELGSYDTFRFTLKSVPGV